MTVVAASIAGYGLGSGAFYPSKPAAVGAALPKMDTSQAQYTCSMHPQVLQDHAGNCPICNMALVRTNSGETVKHAEMMHVDGATQKRMGLQLATASVTEINRSIHAFASISADESTTVSVNPKVEGFLRRLHVQGVGQPVHRGQVLYEIYSPELQQRQREYIDLLARKDGLLGDSMTIVSSNAAMVGSLSKEKFRARERLIAADMSVELVDQLEKTRRVIDVVAVRAAHDGVVTVLGMHEGNYVNPMQQILAYADYSVVWAEVALYPDQLEWIRNGDHMLFRSGLDKTMTQTGKVNTGTLQIDPATRTAKLRLSLSNPHGAFRPGAYADVDIQSNAKRSLTIPRDAVIRTGHGDFVVVAEAGEHFRSARIQLGIESSEMVAVQSGLKPGDQVAVNGQFLLDGAASMQALQARLDSNAPAKTMTASPKPAAMHDHAMMGMQP
ncbi:efflux RND transporter periplasmic adaptor subunit [Duganella sp. FT135W]|uniref:Efflux RND transporter periplasmic adaptor subunit n=1 Tax=Duganella flavida TaxID=2692175 RepID=A0A6L8K9P0_9BURK|nr:efflux RND transporter periplasmic adaptor subunit [Duganella flavida]